MTMVKVRCREGRFVGREKYIAGRDYTIDAVRVGKYREYFEVGLQDEAVVDREWGAVRAEFDAQQRYRSAQSDVANALEVLKQAGILEPAGIAKAAAAKAGG